ncbi:MAG TPA: glycosyltransferase family 4 protein [Tepidiformaceae bacterium]|nr:glycosyltransferase family 4 protein [Tepidiformaceae bacterium]
MAPLPPARSLSPTASAVPGSAPLRVALLTSAKSWRGSGVSLSKIATGLAGRGHHPLLLAGAPAVRAAFEQLQLPAMHAPTANTGLREARELRRILQGFRPDVVLVDKPRDLRLAAMATIGLAIRILYRYNIGVRDPGPGIGARLVFSRVSACIFQAEQVRRGALARDPWLAGAPGYVIPNGYDTDVFRPDASAGVRFRARNGLGEESFLLLSAAALETEKGHLVALDALERIPASLRARVIYLLCGVGRRADDLRVAAQRAGVKTRFLGFLGTDELASAMNAADLILHPSLEDIFPNAVGEAMACGRPVVATDVGGIPELVGSDGSAGALVGAADPAALATAIVALLADASIRARLGASARRRIEAGFTIQQMVSAYENVLRPGHP